ncbi:MAG: type II secretion system F family protein [Proteobacteria bacterium]|nr:type II secretion system F family protein [Pseudomonadota bacterium]
MPSWTQYAFFGMLIGAALFAAAVVAEFMTRSMQRRSALRRLDETAVRERGQAALLRAARSDKAEHGAAGRLADWFLRLYAQGGSQPAPMMLAMVAAGSAAAAFLLFNSAINNALAAGALALCVGAGAPLLLLLRNRARRRAKFAAQLPDAIEVIVRSLKAGHPLTTAIGMVARDLPAPIGDEFAACSQEMTYGLDLQSAVRAMADRVGAPEASVLASAVAIQQRSGGNLGEVLTRLSKLLRDRAKLQAKAKALSSEGRYSGMFLSAMPFIMFGLVTLFNPDYYGQVRNNPIVTPILVGTFIWMVMGSFVINRMVNFKP